jgi:predicted nucleic acid-binding protein
MIVVADAGPLHYLILLSHVDLLHRFYGEVVVPDAVANELTVSSAPEPVRDWILDAPGWLKIVSVEAGHVQEVTAELDLRERSAIALAGAIEADLLLIDEAAGRAEARRRNLRVTGTLGVLRAAAELGLVDVPGLIVRLRATSFYADVLAGREDHASLVGRNGCQRRDRGLPLLLAHPSTQRHDVRTLAREPVLEQLKVLLSKTTARKKHVSSSSMGYTPATNGWPSASRPLRCQRITSSVTGRNRRCGHSAHLIRGFSQMPRTHSFAHAGA